MTVTHIARLLDLAVLLERKSFFLFGPRATGKSYLIRTQLEGARVFNLLDSGTLRDLSKRPELIGERLLPGDTLVVIDEIQRLPDLSSVRFICE